MLVNSAAVGAAAVAALVVFLVGAQQPAQVIVGAAAAAAFLAVLLQGRRSRMTGWYTVRLLLAGNLVVLGIGSFRSLGALLAAVAILSGSLLAALALISYARQLRASRWTR
jgi:hypothetical protein